MYMGVSDPERGQNACVLMLINYLENIRNIVKGLLNVVVTLVKVFRVKERASTPKNNQTVVNIASNAKQMCSKTWGTSNSDGLKFAVPSKNMPKQSKVPQIQNIEISDAILNGRQLSQDNFHYLKWMDGGQMLSVFITVTKLYVIDCYRTTKLSTVLK